MKRVLIANRGEIALRILRACHELGLEALAVYSDVDRNARHVTLADASFCIGPGPVTKSYLQPGAILAAATAMGADAVHPGYGFLAENAEFADACTEAGLIFVGPSAEAIRQMGDKAQARRVAGAAGVPLVPGADIADIADLERQLPEMSFPVLMKAAAGGGGRGMRIVERAEDATQGYMEASREAEAAFGSGVVYWERYVRRARHIEVQVLADRHGAVIDVGERDCTVQRRHQKLVEETPAHDLPDAIREQALSSARALAKGVDYLGAGTVEYIYDLDTGLLHFIEMNTRIQVEHPVSEMVSGADLVREQIRIARGDPIDPMVVNRTLNGHAIECRINAEAWRSGFVPSPGVLSGLVLPGGPGVRVDTHLTVGSEIPPFYDSMIAKIIVHAPDREQARLRMLRALNELQVEGVPTTADLHELILSDPDFASMNISTKWLETRIDDYQVRPSDAA